MHRRAAAATLAILLAACGGSGGGGDDTATGSDGGEAGGEASPEGGAEAPVAGGDGFCGDLEAFVAVADGVTTALFDEDAPALAEALAAYPGAAAAVTASAPPELAGDVATAAGASDEVVAALDGVDLSDTEAVGTAFQAAEPQSPETAAAADRVSEYARAECGFDPAAVDGTGAGSAAVGDADGGSGLPQAAEPADACTFVDPQPVAAAAGVTVDVTDQDGGGDIDLGSLATKSCSYGNGRMTISTVTYAGDAEDARQNFVDNVESNDGTVLTDVDLGTLPESTLVAEVDGFTSINVLDTATPFGIGFADPIDAAAVVAAAEAVLVQAG